MRMIDRNIRITAIVSAYHLQFLSLFKLWCQVVAAHVLNSLVVVTVVSDTRGELRHSWGWKCFLLYVHLHLTLINGDGWWPTCCLLCTAFDLLLDPANEAHVAHH
jgi:hypothetical protein